MDTKFFENTTNEKTEEMDPALAEHLKKLDEKGIMYSVKDVSRRELLGD